MRPNANKKPWRAIIEGPAVAQAWQFIEKLAVDLDELEKKYRDEPSFHIFSVGFGASLFSYYHFLATGEKKHQLRAQKFLNLAAESIGSVSAGDDLLSGFTGTAWLTEHFKEKKWSKTTDPNIEIDKYLQSKINQALRLKKISFAPYSLADTWIGYGIFGLERLPSQSASSILEKLVQLLNKRGTKSSQGIAWFTPKNCIDPDGQKLFRKGYFDLGVAHGLAGVIGFLADALRFKISPRLTRELLEDSVKHLLAQGQDKPLGYFFPQSASKKSEPGKPRLAWCYGDLGTSLVLFHAAEVLKDASLEEKALAMALRATKMVGESSLVIDPYFCHGTSGALHLFNRLYKQTGRREFLDSAHHWGRETFKMLAKTEEPDAEFNLITGKTGVGLVLLSAITDLEPKWDRLVLASPY